jgi:hypothetical protein
MITEIPGSPFATRRSGLRPRDRIIFESVGNLDHSRHRLEIKPFMGGDYTLRLIGNGMTSEEYSTLVKHVTAARAGQ